MPSLKVLPQADAPDVRSHDTHWRSLAEYQALRGLGAQVEVQVGGPIEPQASAAVEPQASAAVEPQASAAVEPQASAAVEPQASAAVEPQASAAVEPQASAAVEPQASAAVEPQASAAVEPQASAAVEPQASVTVGPLEGGPVEVQSFDLLTGTVSGVIRGVTRVDPDELGQGLAEALSRRSFMQLLGGGLGVAGLEGCFKPPNGKLLPYAKQAADLIPGEPLHYATGLEIDGQVTPLLVTCFDGRPIKVEGNPEHPENLGSTGVFEQTLLEQLYDPTRAQNVREGALTRSEDSLRTDLGAQLKQLQTKGGEGLRLLCSPTSSAMVRARRAAVLQKFPKAKIVEYSALNLASADVTPGTREAFGSPLKMRHMLSRAEVVVALDADFLWTQPYGQKVGRDFTARRAPHDGLPMNRLYVVESNLSITGMMADHRLRARSSEIGALGLALLREVLAQRPLPGLSAPAVDIGVNAKFVQAAARDLVRAAGRGAVLVGPRQPAEVHAVGHLLNLALGNVGQTLSYLPTAVVEAAVTSAGETPGNLATLVQEIDQKKVELLVVTANDPAFSAPSDLDFGARLAAVPFSIYLAAYEDETAKRARWTVPAAHPFEVWGDGLAADGSAVVLQPLLAPLFDGKSEMDLLGWLLADATPTHALLRATWDIHPAAGSQGSADDRWAALLRTGFAAALPAPTAIAPALGAEAAGALAKVARSRQASAPGELELEFYPSYQVHDGRFGRNGWLLELPDPVTKLTWTNAAQVSPRTAEKLQLQAGDVVELSLAGHTLKLPVNVVPGHADAAVSVALGFGQPSPLALTGRAGGNAYVLRQSGNPWFAPGLKLQKTGERRQLPLTQEHWSMEGRELAIEVPASEVGRREHLAGESHPAEAQPSFYPPVKYAGLKWAMAIDLARCSGCSACVVACQSENNIPIVGEDQVARGREMHWIRLDRYFTGESLDDPGAIAQPVACVHCENAPCEYVCPVNATVHSDEGLNDMVYNRCVGTRYCSNNCPYKVRRFNYLNYSYGNKTEVEKLATNPEVTVRARGVMEKCTYCVQRIERGRINARVQGRDLRDGDIRTACQSACPTQAISFGTLSDPHSQVSRWRDDPRSYQLLKELGTRPRTTHLVRLKNKNPELA